MAALVAVAGAALVLSKWLRELLARRRQRRRLLYTPALDGLIAELPGASALALRPRGWGDAAVVEEMLAEALLTVRGPLQEKLAQAAEELGLADRRLEALSERAWHRRAEAAERLGILRSRKAVAPLVDLLEDPEPAVQLAATRALGRMRAPEALPALLKALERMPGPSGSPIAQALMEFGEQAQSALIQALGPRSLVRSQAAQILGELRSLQAVPGLVRILTQDEDPEARASAASALGTIADPQATHALREGLGDVFREVRARCAWALGMIGDPSACAALEKAMLTDGYWWVRVRAAEALAKLGQNGAAALRRHAAGRDPQLRVLSAEMLAFAGAQA